MIRCYQLFDPARVLVAAEVDSTLRTKFNAGVVLSNDTSTPVSGLIRWNGSVFQGYNGSAWETFGTAENVVELQGSSPGTPQTGHANLSGVIVAGGFSGPLTGNVSGDCSGSSGSCTGNAATATKWGSYAGITGPSTARTFTLPDADATLLYSGGALGTPASGTLTNCTFPTLNQDTTGSAVYWKTSGTGKAGISGPGTGQTRTYTYPDQDATILYSGGALGTPASGTLTNCTFPTLNQSTTGSAASLSISGQTGLLTFTGLASTNRAKTIRDAADTILELGGSYTPTGTWNWTSATVTWPTFNQNTSGSSASCTGNAATATKWGSYAGISGPSTARTFTLPDADATLLYSGGALGTPASGTLTSCTIPYTGVSGMTQGYVPFAGASGLTQDGNLFWDNSNKRLGIGMTNPGAKLQIYDSQSTDIAIVKLTNTYNENYIQGFHAIAPNAIGRHFTGYVVGQDFSARNAGTMGFYYGSSGSTSNYLYFGGHSVDDAMVLTMGGKVGIGNTSPSYLLTMESSGGGYYDTSDHSWHNGSSIRWKDNIETIQNPLDLVMQLRGVNWTWKDNGNPGTGLIAEEVFKVIPSVCSVDQNDPEYCDGISEQRLIGVLVEAIKAQQAEINALKAKLN